MRTARHQPLAGLFETFLIRRAGGHESETTRLYQLTGTFQDHLLYGAEVVDAVRSLRVRASRELKGHDSPPVLRCFAEGGEGAPDRLPAEDGDPKKAHNHIRPVCSFPIRRERKIVLVK